MPEFSLPEGFYISVANVVRARFGGQTRAHLMRNRFFTQHAGIETTIVSLDLQPVYPLERERLAERGELVPGMRLLNIFESYRDGNISTDEPQAEAMPALDHLASADVEHPDGTIYYTAYREPETEDERIRDYRRADGSVFLRGPAPGVVKHPSQYVLGDAQGRPVRSWPKKTGWVHHWFNLLAGDAERVFVICDSRTAFESLTPMPDDRYHFMQLLHNVHLHGNRQWNAKVSPLYQPILNQLEGLDGLVTLTRRQREDIRQLMGKRNNVFTVSNPVTVPQAPDPLPERDPNRFTVVSRFEIQKRIDHAVRAFALVVAERPEAQLLIYGRGALRGSVEQLIDELGLKDNIHLCGWDPDARDRLWTSSGFLLSSGFEGYPLATLESMSRGCPVISYDIKYGPQEQINDCVNGFLVPDRDQRAMADRVIQLLDDPELVRRFSTAARQEAVTHDYRAFMASWQQILSTVAANKARRVHLDRVDCRIDELGFLPTPLPRRLTKRVLPVRRSSASLHDPRRLSVKATATVKGRWPSGELRRARWTLDALSHTETVTRLPLQVRREKRTFQLTSVFPLDRAFAGRNGDSSVRLRLRMVLGNAAWETMLTRPTGSWAPYEVAYELDGRLVLHHQPAGRADADRG